MATPQEYFDRYVAAIHGVQSAINYEIQNERSTDTSPKQLRVGLSSALIDSGTLGRLLIDKGVFTEEEYAQTLAEMAEAELASYEEKYGVKFR